MAVFTEMHNGTKYARVYLPNDSGAIGTTHLSAWHGYRHGLTLCGLGLNQSLLPLPASWSGAPPYPCRSCKRSIEAGG